MITTGANKQFSSCQQILWAFRDLITERSSVANGVLFPPPPSLAHNSPPPLSHKYWWQVRSGREPKFAQSRGVPSAVESEDGAYQLCDTCRLHAGVSDFSPRVNQPEKHTRGDAKTRSPRRAGPRLDSLTHQTVRLVRFLNLSPAD